MLTIGTLISKVYSFIPLLIYTFLGVVVWNSFR